MLHVLNETCVKFKDNERHMKEGLKFYQGRNVSAQAPALRKSGSSVQPLRHAHSRSHAAPRRMGAGTRMIQAGLNVNPVAAALIQRQQMNQMAAARQINTMNQMAAMNQISHLLRR